MLASYKDAATGQFSAAVPVIWERPAGFATEIAGKLRDYGPLTERVFKITRNGAANSMQTTYAISYIPVYDKPEAVPADFSAFNNFNIAKHSFWEKSAEDMNTFLATGSFPEYVKNQAPAEGAYVAPAAPAASTPTYTQPNTVVTTTTPYVAPAAPVVEEAPVTAQPAVNTDRPQRNFGGFSF
jgi:hypothetical protein